MLTERSVTRDQTRALVSNGTAPTQAGWPAIFKTDIPNDNSNLNAGELPNGTVYLVHNPVTPANGKAFMRDPVTVATSADGFTFRCPLSTFCPGTFICSFFFIFFFF